MQKEAAERKKNMITSVAIPPGVLHPVLCSHPRRSNHRTPGFCPSAHFDASRSPIRLRKRQVDPPSASPSELPSSEAGSPPPTVDDGFDSDSDSEPSQSEGGDGIEVEIAKVGRNQRRIRARVGVDARLEAVWNVLTDYEGLAGFIPSLAVCRLIEKRDGFARLYQVGLQDLALGLKFQAKGTLDCFEKDLEIMPSGRRREIEFKMIEGDFQRFEGSWSIRQVDDGCEEVEFVQGQDFPTTLSYDVVLEPKLWLPVQLLEGRLCREIKTNLLCLRDEAHRVKKLEG